MDYLNSVLLTLFVLCFLFVWKHIFCWFFLLVVFFSMMSEWNESCTESISCIQVNGSIIKDQIGVLSVSVRQPALQGHLVADHGTARPCSEGCCCHHTGGSLILSDSSLHCWFCFVFFQIFLCHSPTMILRTPSLREHTFMNLVPF